MTPLKLTIGSDPELVIVNQNRIPCSAIGILKTDKHNPIDLGDGVKLYADNALAELSFPPSTLDGIVGVMTKALNKARKALEGYCLAAQAATVFHQKELEHALFTPEGKKKVSAFDIGCNENFDAYNSKEFDFKANPMGTFTDGLRTGSFHIHVGNADWQTTKDERLLSDESKIMAIKLMDLYVGLASIVFDKDPTSHARRKLYGKAGEFRPTPYGVEYRVLGNYALRSLRLMELVFKLTGLAMTHIGNNSAKELLSRYDEKETQRIINDHDTHAAMDTVCKMGLPIGVLTEVLAHRSIPSTDILHE